MTRYVHVKNISITTEERFTDCWNKRGNGYDVPQVITGKPEEDNADIKMPSLQILYMSDYGSCAKR